MTEQTVSYTEDVDKKATTALSLAKGISIASTDEYQGATSLLKDIKGIQREIDDTFSPVISAAHIAHQQAISAKKKHSEPLKDAERLLKGKVSGYLINEEKKRRAEEARRQEEARKQAEEEQLARAIEAEEFGENEEAEDIIHEEISVAPVIVEKTVPKVQGISKQMAWKFRVVDAAKLPREYLVPDDKKIGVVVRALKSEARIAGVETWEEPVIRVGGGRL